MSMSDTALQIELPSMQQDTAKLAGAVVKFAREVAEHYNRGCLSDYDVVQLRRAIENYDIKAATITRLPE